MNKELTTEEFKKIRNIPMVFIMGKERSGTTLLQTLLDEHPNIIAPPESEFIVLLYPRFGKINKWSEKDIYNFVGELYKEPWITKIWRIERKFLTSMLLSIKDNADYASICKTVFYCIKNNKENIILFSDKNPIYILFISTLLRIFPETKFIHLVRDPRDNVHSHLKSFNVKNVRFIAMKWLSYNKIMTKAKKRMPEKVDTILYENLVNDPESIMKKLCVFLDVPFDIKMIHNAFPERLEKFSSQKLIFDRALNVHANLLKPVNTSNVGKWKTGMSSERVQIVETITGAFASANYKYDIGDNTPHFSFSTRLKILKSYLIYYTWQFFTRIKYKSYRFNKLYTRFNILIRRETRVFGKVLRES